MKTIWTELPRVFNHPDDKKARESMMLAATQAHPLDRVVLPTN
jgi:alcohol dehydrogenase class IV